MDRTVSAYVAKVQSTFPEGCKRISVLGSTSFYSNLSEPFCNSMGALLAAKGCLLVGGGMTGAAETMARAMFKANPKAHIFHLLPVGARGWDYGITLPAGKDMEERRMVLGRCVSVHIVVEGGPGTAHEIEIASGNRGVVIPIKCTGGAASGMFDVGTEIFDKPKKANQQDWDVILNETDADKLAQAVYNILISVTE